MSLARPVRIAARSKYHARPTVVDGIRFASQAEARRYSDLRLLERAGQIWHLQCQPVFRLTVPDLAGEPMRVGTYVADFQYWRGPVLVVEDVKGYATPLYRLKKKLVQALYGIQIQEIP